MGSTLVYYNSTWPGSLDEVLDPLVISLRASGLRLDENSLREQVAHQIILHEPQADEDYREIPALQVLEQILHQLAGQAVAPVVVYAALRAMYKVAETHWTAESEAIPLLERLRSGGCKIGVISNAADHENMENILAKAGFNPYLDCSISSAQFGYGKPHSAIFQHALSLLQATPATSVMVGDKLEADVLGANKVGMRAVWLTRRAKSADNPNTDPLLQPWKTANNLAEILSFLPHD